MGALPGCYLESSMQTKITPAGAIAFDLREGRATVTYTRKDSTDCEQHGLSESCRHDAMIVTDPGGRTALINDIESTCVRADESTEGIHYSFLECTGHGYLGTTALTVKAKFSERPLFYPYYLMTAGEIRDQTGSAFIQKTDEP